MPANIWQTSALDTHTEQEVLQNIRSIIREKARTSVFVAHRLRTIYDSDMIIVLQGGQVAESGTHNELLDKGGLYAELWSVQETSPADEDGEGGDEQRDEEMKRSNLDDRRP